MKKRFAPTALLLLSITTAAQEISVQQSEMSQDSVVFSNDLKSLLDSISLELKDEVAYMDVSFDEISDNPLYYKLFMPLVLYGSTVSDAISPRIREGAVSDILLPLDPLETGSDYTLARMIDEALVKVYLEHPELVKMTEEELLGVPVIIPISDDLAMGIRLNDSRANGRRP